MKTITLFIKKSIFLCLLAFCFFAYSQEIEVNADKNPAVSIADNDNTPDINDFTDFNGTISRDFFIDNIQTGGNVPDLVIDNIILSNTIDFSVNSITFPYGITNSKNSELPFIILFQA